MSDPVTSEDAMKAAYHRHVYRSGLPESLDLFVVWETCWKQSATWTLRSSSSLSPSLLTLARDLAWLRGEESER